MQGAITVMIILTDVAYVLVVLRVHRLVHAHLFAESTAPPQSTLHMKPASHSTLKKAVKPSQSTPVAAAATAAADARPVPAPNQNNACTRSVSSTAGSQSDLDGMARGRQVASAVAESAEAVGGESEEAAAIASHPAVTAHSSPASDTGAENEARGSPHAADDRGDVVRGSLCFAVQHERFVVAGAFAWEPYACCCCGGLGLPVALFASRDVEEGNYV